MYVERNHLKIYFQNILIQLTVFNKNRQMAKSKIFKNQNKKQYFGNQYGWREWMG
jgi:hypothetical protein